LEKTEGGRGTFKKSVSTWMFFFWKDPTKSMKLGLDNKKKK